MKLSIWGGLGALPLDWPGLPYRRMLRHSEATEAAILAWAAKRRNDQRSDDLLSILIAQPDHRGKPASPASIAGHIPVLFGASYETCQAGLGWSLFLLAQHPDGAERRAAERAATGEAEPPYLEWVVKEAMRLFPPVPYQARRVAADTELLGEAVPQNSRIFISALMTNRNPEIYPEPERFRPERWEKLNPSAYEYMTFSAGPRTCIGLWFGVTAVKRALAGILRHAKVELKPGARIGHYVAVTMGPKPGLPGILRPVGGRWQATRATGPAAALVQLPE
jgi:cytochrome P450